MTSVSNKPDSGPLHEDDLTPEESPALATCLEDCFFETRRLRHDGWNGRRMAAFCGTLAETGIVTFASRSAGMSAQSAYALRHRNPIFARAWEAALHMARHRLADDLLARSLKGSHEVLLRNGAIVAERQHYDNKLAFSVLRRLDRRAELGATFRTPPTWEQREPAPAIKGQWNDLIEALANDREDDAEYLLTEVKIDPEVDDLHFENEDSESESENVNYVRRRVWQTWDLGEWRTDFPPPTGFCGDEQGNWEDAEGYSRSLTDDEMAALVAAGVAENEIVNEISIEDDAAERDAFFADLVASTVEQESAPFENDK